MFNTKQNILRFNKIGCTILNRLILLILLSGVTYIVLGNQHNEASLKGLEIAQAMKTQDKGYKNYSAEMNMVLINTKGKEKNRQLRMISREIDQDGDQSIAIFDKPADVKGVAFLIHSHIGEDDDQWLYLPAIKRVKRISPKNKTAPFMGSEFSYEDLSSTEMENYTYQYIKDELYNNENVFVIDRFPVDPLSGYQRERVWIEKKRLIPLKIEYYNRKKQKLKTLFSSDFKQYLGRYWRPLHMRMLNHINGKQTRLIWRNIQYRQTLMENDFHPNSLRRFR